jgi:methionyl-tRNA formyltransferase
MVQSMTSSGRSSKIERIVFFGTDAFATPSFEAIVAAEYKIVALVTEPTRQRGHGPDAVAGAWRLPILEPEEPTSREFEKKLRSFSPDAQVGVGYGASLTKALLDIAPRGTIKVHPALLPRHRGVHPIPSAILSGDKETGVTSFLVTEKMDAGPILLSKSMPIGEEETAGDIAPRLARLAAELIVETLAGLNEGTLQSKAQEESRASQVPSIETEPVWIDWSENATALSRRIRAYCPVPGVMASYQGRTLVIARAMPAGAGSGEPGTVLQTGFDGIFVVCGGKTRLRITQIQPEGQRAMSPSSFVAKYRVATGTRFD